MNRNTKGWSLVGLQAVLLVALVVLPWRTPASDLWPPSVAELVGIAMVALSGVLAVIAMSHLSTALTPTPVPRPDGALRTHGAYRIVRHPIYSSLLLGAAGFTVAVGSVWQVAVTAALAVFFTLKSRWEDTMLAERFGDQWHAYAQRTGALVPRPPRRSQAGSP